MPELQGSQLLQDKVRSDPRFEVHTNTQVTSLEGEDGKLKRVLARDRATGEEHAWQPSGAFIFVGLDPNSGFLGDALALDQWGFIETGNGYETSMAGVFAAGDVRTTIPPNVIRIWNRCDPYTRRTSTRSTMIPKMPTTTPAATMARKKTRKF